MSTSILIVDDDLLFCHVVSDFLGDRGYVPTVVRSIEAARAWLDDGEPLVALVDIYLEQGDGLSLCRHIRDQAPDTAILLMTARPEGFVLGDESGVLIDDFWVKGNDLTELGRRVAARVEQAQSLRSLRQRERVLALLAEVARTISEITDLATLAGTLAGLLLRFPGVRGARLTVPGVGSTPSMVTLLEAGESGGDARTLDAVELDNPGGGWLVLQMEGTARVDRDVVETLARMISSAVSAARTFESLRERQVRLEHGYAARQRQLASALARVERLTDARDSLVALLSHDLRSPLAVIIGNCQLVEESGFKKEQVAKTFEVVRRQAERMNRMVEELLDRYRRDRGGGPATEVGDLADIAREMVLTFEPVAAAKQQQVVGHIQGPARVDADLAELREVFANLIENALRHSPPGSTVTVSVAPAVDQVHVEVRDQGPGFGKSSAPGGSGLGLGLRASQRIVAAAGGTLHLGDHPRGGAAATFDLPLAGVTPGALWILLVGRDTDELDFLADSLGRTWVTGIASDASQAEQRLRRGSPAVIVVHVAEGEDDPGVAFLRTVKGDEDLAAIPVIAVAPARGGNWTEQLLRLGAYQVMRRPVDADTLHETVRRLMKLVAEAYQSVIGRERDALTGAESTEYARHRLPALLADYTAARRPFPLLVVDVPSLSDVNRTWGWAIGDHLLVWLANNLRERCGAGEWVFRGAGGHFVVVTNEKELDGATRRAERLVAELASARPRLGVARVPVRVSAKAIDAVVAQADADVWNTVLRGVEEG